MMVKKDGKFPYMYVDRLPNIICASYHCWGVSREFFKGVEDSKQ